MKLRLTKNTLESIPKTSKRVSSVLSGKKIENLERASLIVQEHFINIFYSNNPNKKPEFNFIIDSINYLNKISNGYYREGKAKMWNQVDKNHFKNLLSKNSTNKKDLSLLIAQMLIILNKKTKSENAITVEAAETLMQSLRKIRKEVKDL